MSGGVDSSVAAALLKKAGFEVAGAFLKCWQADKENYCSTDEDQRIARLVANKIGIPFYTFDFTREYKEKVIDYFIKEYARGKTPNPDIICNQEIKFGILLKKATALGFHFLATGHYARVEAVKDRIKLLKGRDKNKDQSYFLYALKPKVLKKIMFPVGGCKKDEVRKMAKVFNLPNADKKDSQGICFVGKVKLIDFLKEYLPPKKGKILLKDGKVIGEHQGFYYYTIGQRKGLHLSSGPYFVLKINPKNNTLIVSRDEKDLYKKELKAKRINWLNKPKLPIKVTAKIRYRHKGAKAKLYSGGRLVFEKPQMAIAPGQSVVFYKGEELLGGGIIELVATSA